MTVHPGNLAGLPPMGQKKPRDRQRKPRKALRKISRKRQKYLDSPERQKGLDYMGAVKMLPCLVCGCAGSEFHHEGKPRSDLKGLPLCPRHHRREFGPGAYHYSPRAFYALHGDSEALLKRVDELLAAYEADCLGTWF